MTTIIRRFKCSVPKMLISAVTAGKNMEAYFPAFAKDYPAWTQQRLTNYYGEIEEVSRKIGLKSAKAQHEATACIKTVSIQAINDAMTIHSQMKRGYRKEKARLESLLQLLGFRKSWAKAARGGQNALIDLLYTFNSNMDEALQNELIAHEVSGLRIESIKKLARELMEANITQEILKSEAPVLTSEMVIRLNEIYDIAIDICDAGKTVFSSDPVRRALFSFAKLTAQQASAGKQKSSDDSAGNTDDGNAVT